MKIFISGGLITASYLYNEKYITNSGYFIFNLKTQRRYY